MDAEKEPVQRGGIGAACRTSASVDPASAHRLVIGVQFAVRWPKNAKTRKARAIAVAEHLAGQPGAVVVEEVISGGRLWLTVAVDPPMRANDARRLAETCPEYAADAARAPRT